MARSKFVMFSLDISGIDKSIIDDIVKRAKEEAEARGATATIRPPRVVLRNRVIRASKKFECRREPNPTRIHAIVWPAGVPHKGCGRTFTNNAQRDAHEEGYTDVARTKSWSPVMFPDGCLDRVLPSDKR